jgi:hypothetical protein
MGAENDRIDASVLIERLLEAGVTAYNRRRILVAGVEFRSVRH